MIYFFISFFLDLIFGNVINTSYQNLNLLFPMLFISSIPISYLSFQNKKIFLILLIVLGLISDLLFSMIFLINTFFFILYYLFLKLIFDRKNSSLINILIISILGIIVYDFYLFLILNLLNYSNFVIEDFYYKVLNSILINSLYIIISLFILKGRILGSKRKKKFN